MRTLRSMRHIRNLRGKGNANSGDFAYIMDGVNDYAYSSHSMQDCAEILNNGTADYISCTGKGGWVSITDTTQEYSTNSRSAQTMKWVGSVSDLLAARTLFSYSGLSTASVKTDGSIEVEVQGTGSARITSPAGSIVAGTLYSIVIRINNSLASGSARVVGDVDIFINGVKQTKGITTTGTSTSTGSFLYWGAYNGTPTNPMIGKMFSLTLWNTVLDDAACISETGSLYSVVNSGSLRTWDPSNIGRALGRVASTTYNLGGNCVVASDADGSHFFCEGNSNGTPGIGTNAGVGATVATGFNELTSFTMKVRCKIITLPATASGGIFASGFDAGFDVTSGGGGQFRGGLRSGATVSTANLTITLNTLYDLFLDYDAVAQKYYFYNGTTLINAGGTTYPGAFTVNDLIMGDSGLLSGNQCASKKNIYHARFYGKMLTHAEKLADIALGNSLPTDPLILYEIRPEGYMEVQLLPNPTDLTNASWTKGVNTTVTGNTSVAPNGLTEGDRVQFTGVGGVTNNKVDTTVTNATIGLSAGELASKIVHVKAFIKSTIPQTCRLRASHGGVSDYYSSDLVISSEWREYTFTQTFTSSTSGTGITCGVVLDSLGTAADIEVWNVRGFFTQDQVQDYASSIGYIGQFTNMALSVWVKPFADAADTALSQVIMNTPYRYMHLRTSNNNIQWRRESKRNANSPVYSLGNGFRKKVHILGVAYISGTDFIHEIWVNGVLQSTHTSKWLATSFYAPSTIGQISGTYNSNAIFKPKVYVGTLTTQEKQLMYLGYEPATAVKWLEFGPALNETGNRTRDLAGTKRVNTMVNGMTRGMV